MLSEIYNLLYQLGVTANYIGFYHICGIAVYRAAGLSAAGDKTAVPGGGKAIWDKLESGGAKYSNGKRYYLAGKPAFTGGTGAQASGTETAKCVASVYPDRFLECRSSGGMTLSAGKASLL